MYKGKIVESGDSGQIFSAPEHPYTKGLVACRPSLNSRPQKLLTVSDYMSLSETETGEIIIQPKTPDIPIEISREDIIHRLSNLEKQQPLLQVRNLKVGFPVKGVFGGTKRYHMAVDNVNFDVKLGETLGLVGESGCGKTTLGRTLLRLIEPMSGEILFEGRDITNFKGQELQKLRRQMQIVFQNPFSALDPRMKVGDAVMEPLVIHAIGNSLKERRDRAAYLLERVGLSADAISRYPHQFSGGQRQRVCIARSLALNPKFIICDESVSALDVSVQAQVLNLLKELQSEFGLTYIFISHDLSVVKFMSDRILVMNRGKIVEQGTAEDIYLHPQEEYTQKLIASIPTGSAERVKQRQRT
jgi:peptide/nickel transport system ATP-binding protein